MNTKTIALPFILLFFNNILHSQVEIINKKESYEPLMKITYTADHKGWVEIKDAKGFTYHQQETPAKVTFVISGALGYHTLRVFNKKGSEIKTVPFFVDCETGINDPNEEWKTLFNYFKFNHLKTIRTEKYNNRIVQMHEMCPRNDANAIRGTQYIYPGLKDGVELFGNLQHESGMIYDLYRWTDKVNTSTLDGRSINTDHFVVIQDGWYYKQRFPVENDLEHFYVQWLWRAWKATGDTEWMKKWLPNAIKALEYSQNTSIRWSEKYNLLKRGFTIDTWDFQPDDEGFRGDHMDVHEDVTNFGIMHGDNTGYAYSCTLLAEMLNVAGENALAKKWENTGKDVFQRIIDLSWNGNYFYHFIPEDSSFTRDLGVDQSKQVSLSNALALQRDIPDEMAQSILKTYRRIKEEMPESSPGEYFGIYPPIEKGYGVMPYHYINGGVFAFIAGELAIGAFDHGFEAYGTDIMRNMKKLMDKQFGQLPYYWIGKKKQRPETNFTPISIADKATIHVFPPDFQNKNSWVGPGPEFALNVLPKKQLEIDDIPFSLVNHEVNDNKGYIGIGNQGNYKNNATVNINKNARSLYILHVLNGGGLTGWITLRYQDGTEWRKYVHSGSEVNNWYFPKNIPYSRNSGWKCKMAWRGKNGYVDVGVYAWGFDNPHPDKKIETLHFQDAGRGTRWLILGITVSDQLKFFNTPDITRYYVNTGWNAGTFLSSLIEGIGGVKNDGLAYHTATIAPKWHFAGENDIMLTSKIPASNGYVRYRYLSKNENAIELQIATSAEKSTIELHIPDGKSIEGITVNGIHHGYETFNRRNSYYVRLNLEKPMYHQIKMSLN